MYTHMYHLHIHTYIEIHVCVCFPFSKILQALRQCCYYTFYRLIFFFFFFKKMTDVAIPIKCLMRQVLISGILNRKYLPEFRICHLSSKAAFVYKGMILTVGKSHAIA